MNILISLFATAFLSVMSKFASQAFFEAVLIKVIVWAGEKLAPMTTNDLDDKLLGLIKEALTGTPNLASMKIKYEPLMAAALAANDFPEYARLHNEFIDLSK